MENRKGHILFADDDQDDIELVSDAVLKRDGSILFHKVCNGRQAIDYLDGLTDGDLPGIIILDYNMPQLTGAEVLPLVCKGTRYKDIPKVILSTSDAKFNIDECRSRGADEYFVKPATYRGLDELAEKILALFT